MELEVINHSSYFFTRFHEYFQTFEKNKTQKNIFIAHRFQFKFPNLLFSTYIRYVHTTSTRQYRENPSTKVGEKYVARPVVEKINDTNGLLFSRYTCLRARAWCARIYTPGQQTPLWLWKLARVQQGQETVSITPQLDLERYSRPCWPAFPVVSALYPCSLPRAQPRVESTGRGCGARIYIYIIGGGSENAFVIVLPTEARELVAVSVAAIPRGRGGRGGRATSFL